jgi:hypothetical protein
MLAKARDALRSGCLFATFVPEPDYKKSSNPDLHSAPDWWLWRVSRWGTRSECCPDGWSDHDPGDGSIILAYDTAWSPPIPFYVALVEQCFEVRAFYLEPGMAFCGRFTGKDGDEQFDLPETATLCVERIPGEIRDVFGLPESHYDES